MKAVRFLTTLALLSLGGVVAYCPPTGPILPPKQTLDYDVLSKSITDDLTKFLTDTDALENTYSVNTTATSFSVRVNGPDKPLFTYHHAADLRNTSGVKEVDDDSVYRVASITKTFTVLAVKLTPGMHSDDPICKYLPELKEGGKAWEGITLEMLGSHISGVPKNFYLSDLAAITQGALVELGFPQPEPPKGIEDCYTGENAKSPDDVLACQTRNFLKTTVSYGLINPPGGRATYSESAFDLLGIALERVHKKRYEEVIQSLILDPLKMKSTTFKVPPNSKGVIPVSSSIGIFGEVGSWEAEFGVNNPTGGMYSTTGDLTKYAHGIPKLLGDTAYRAWLKPRSFSSSKYEYLGTPWEIYRPTNYTKTERPIDVYTKSGSFVNFVSLLGFIPEYDVSFTIMVSAPSPQTAIYAIQNAMFASVITNSETLVLEAARKKYVGMYTSSSNISGNMTVTMDDGPGLKITGWYNNNTDMQVGYGALYGLIFPDPKTAPPSAASNPSGAANGDDSSTNSTPSGGGDEAGSQSGFTIRLYTVDEEGHRWRITPELKIIQEQNGQTFQQCTTFFQDDIWSYNMQPIDEILFNYDKSGNVVGMDIPVLQAKLEKQSGGSGSSGKGAEGDL